MGRAGRSGLSLCLLGLALACAAPDTPMRAYRRWLDHLAAGRIAQAYRMMTPEFQKGCDLGCFGRVTRQSEARIKEAQRQAQGPMTLELRTELGAGADTLTLVRQETSQSRPAPWRISGDPLDFYPQDTAPRALRSFLRLVEARRYDLMSGFVPESLRPRLSAESLRERWEGPERANLLRQIAAVRAHVDQPMVYEGSTARLPVGEGREARLVLEEGLWRLEQLQ